jgi:hypothetical protein
VECQQQCLLAIKQPQAVVAAALAATKLQQLLLQPQLKVAVAQQLEYLACNVW